MLVGRMMRINSHVCNRFGRPAATDAADYDLPYSARYDDALTREDLVRRQTGDDNHHGYMHHTPPQHVDVTGSRHAEQTDSRLGSAYSSIST